MPTDVRPIGAGGGIVWIGSVCFRCRVPRDVSVGSLVDKILSVHGLIVYVIVGGLVFAEDAVFVGFFVPGETAAVLGGVVASRGNADLAVMCTVVVLAAIVGDSIGFGLGARYGDRLVGTRVLRKRAKRIDRARDQIRRHGGMAVIIGRFVAFLRAVTPFLAGTSHLSYRRFLAFNIAGGIVWGVGSVLLGYAVGDSYKTLESLLGPVTAGIVGVLAVAGLIAWSVSRRRREAHE
jgi:membrane protein DedA with SNARE-associated domain